jgi:hypothetical protein
MVLWEDRERRRLEFLASVEQADASMARGAGRTISTREEAELDGIWIHIAPHVPMTRATGLMSPPVKWKH